MIDVTETSYYEKQLQLLLIGLREKKDTNYANRQGLVSGVATRLQ